MMLSENLHLPPSLCRPLSQTVHNKTGGIILFVTNYIKTLNEEGLLYYNLTLGKWQYDIHQIQRKSVSEDGVAEYLTQQMTRLPIQVQLALRIAACFGFVIDTDILEAALLGLGIDTKTLNEIVMTGFLQKLPKQYQWTHDQIRSAAYDLIPHEKRKSFHLLVGSRLLVNTRSDQLDDAIFDIVHHMNIGAEMMKTKEQREEISRLNVLAGKKAISSFSFHSAVKYLLAAISMHGEEDDDKEASYAFLMEVYNLALGSLFAIADFHTLQKIIDKILDLSQSFEESLNAHRYLVRLHAASENYEGESHNKEIFVASITGRLSDHSLAGFV